MGENRPMYDWQKSIPMEVWRQETDKDLDMMVQEIIRLQERVYALDKAQSRPDNAFWGQLIFDIGIVLIVLIMYILK